MEKKRGKRKRSASVKSQVRGIERLLKVKGDSMPDRARKELEQRVEELKRVGEDRKARERASKVRAHYKRFKFYERKKLKKRREKIDKLLATGDIEYEKAMAEKEQIYRDLLYVKFFPENEPYISLFPKTPHSEKALEAIKKVRDEVEHRLAHGDTLDAESEESVSGGEPNDGDHDEDALLQDASDDDDETKREESGDNFFEEENSHDDENRGTETTADVSTDLEVSRASKKTRRGTRGSKKRKPLATAS